MARFVLWGIYCANALEKRTPFREEHLNRLATLKENGTLITLGPTTSSSHVFGIFEGNSIEEIRDLIKDDIYWKKRIWTDIEVYPWTQAF